MFFLLETDKNCQIKKKEKQSKEKTHILINLLYQIHIKHRHNKVLCTVLKHCVNAQNYTQQQITCFPMFCYKSEKKKENQTCKLGHTDFLTSTISRFV